MAAATYSTNLSGLYTSDAEDDTNWSALGGGAAGLNIPETDYYIQGLACATKNAFAATTKGFIRDNLTDAGGSGTDGAYIAWMTHTAPNSLANKAAGGMQFVMGSSTGDYYHYYVGGADTMTFQGWLLVAVNEAATPDATTGTPTAGVEQTHGGLWYLPTGGPTKGAPNAMDGIRYGRCDIVIEFGDVTPNGPATLDAVITSLETPTNRYGLLAQRQPGGAFENSGLLQFGSVTNAVYFVDSNKTVNIRDHDHVTANFNTWQVVNASSQVDLTNYVVSALGTTSPGRFVNADNATLNWTTCSWIDMGTFQFGTNSTIDTNTFLRCGQITHGGGVLNGSTVADSAVAADVGALLYNEAADPNGEMDNMIFSKGANAHHAIEFGTSSPLGITLTGVDVSGFNAANGQNDSTLYIRRTTGTVNIYTVGCTGTFSYKSDGATVNIIPNPVNLKMIVKDQAGSFVVGAFAYIDDNNATPFIMNTTTDISGEAAVSYSDGPTAGTTWRVRKYGYRPYVSTVDISTSDITIPVTLITDPQQT